MVRPRAVVSWSGGKDCCLALHRSLDQFEVVALITMMTEDGQRSRSHGLRSDLLAKQSASLGLQFFSEPSTWENYEQAFQRLLVRARDLDATHVIFGDLYPDAHKAWAEAQCKQQGMIAVEPLWSEPSESVAREFIGTGATALIVTVRDDKLDTSFLGKLYSNKLIDEFSSMGIDPCGERGEFHTFVTWHPAFSQKIVTIAQKIHREKGCSALDLELCDSDTGLAQH